MKMNNFSFEKFITDAYATQSRTVLWLSACLMQEAGELAEHYIKNTGYSTPYDKRDILGEAGDVLNFLTAILHQEGLTLEDAMKNNVKKLMDRKWIARSEEAVTESTVSHDEGDCVLCNPLAGVRD